MLTRSLNLLPTVAGRSQARAVYGDVNVRFWHKAELTRINALPESYCVATIKIAQFE